MSEHFPTGKTLNRPRTRHKLGRWGLGALLACVITVGPHASPPARAAQAYLDPGLATMQVQASVIVTAQNSRAAAEAVRAAGGTVTSDLWLIDAVAATIPGSRISALAATTGVRSVVLNRGVESSDADGWVSQLRVKKFVQTMGLTVNNPPAYLSDGAYVVVDDGGNLLIANADGTTRARASLSGGPYTAPLTLGPGDISYIAGQARYIYAINPDGTVRWRFSEGGSTKFLGGVVIGTNGMVYASDDGRTVYALDADTGARLWTAKIGTSGAVTRNPTIGPDNTLYVATDKGVVTAVNPNGTTRWTYNTAVELKLTPLLGSDGTLYVASTGDKKLFALDAASGALRWSFATNGPINDMPVIGPDGSVYVTSEAGLYGLNASGSSRFYFAATGGKFMTSPVLSPDGATVYAAVVGKNLFAINTTTGAQRWSSLMAGNMTASPVLDSDGNVVTVSDMMEVVGRAPDGSLAWSTKTTLALKQKPGVGRKSGDVTVRNGSNQLITFGHLPDKWDGRRDVLPTGDKKVFQFVNPTPVDVGADELHTRPLSSGGAITGAGVNVAVLDSGVYFDPATKSVLGNNIAKQFVGQIDYVTPECAKDTSSKKVVVYGTQYADACFTDYMASRDTYGHGSHVAGIIWNNVQDQVTGLRLGVAPDANILSVRVLGDDGSGSYETVVKGVQYVVANKARFGTRVLNLSLSASADVPYFVDPLNRAVERAWQSGIVVLAAAGNTGPGAETITVPGNDPYVITVGAVNSKRTPGFWSDDVLPEWSANGPTLDGFAKPDILAPGSQIMSFMYNNGAASDTARLAMLHPDNSMTDSKGGNISLFRMNGTSMATGVASGVVALMLQQNPSLTPDQVKYRLLDTARPALEGDTLVYNVLQQGAGRIWAPDAVASRGAEGNGNPGMDLSADLAHGYATPEDIAFHYQGPIQKMLSDDGQAHLYYIEQPDGTIMALGAKWEATQQWVDQATLASGRMSWAGGDLSLASGRMSWAGGLSLASGRMSWAGGRMSWAGGRMSWAGGRMSWAGGRMSWAGGTDWTSQPGVMAEGRMSWAGSGGTGASSLSTTSWVIDGNDW